VLKIVARERGSLRNLTRLPFHTLYVSGDIYGPEIASIADIIGIVYVDVCAFPNSSDI